MMHPIGWSVYSHQPLFRKDLNHDIQKMEAEETGTCMDETEAFIDLLENERVLWDPSDPSDKNVYLK